MDYIYRGTRPKPMAAPGPKRISTPAGDRLSTVMENNASSVHPALRPARFNLSNLSLGLGRHSRNQTTTIPEEGAEKPPPRYSTIYDGPEDEQEGGLKGQLHRRGGWKRVIAGLVALILVIALALGVGLGVGLKHSSSSTPVAAPGQAPPNNDLPPQAWPLGQYTISTYLATMSTACTSDPGTWTCLPQSVTYSQDPSEAGFQYVWVIANSSSSSNLVIWSSNPFSSFGPIDLNLVDQGTSQERYTFSTTIPRPVAPTSSLTDENVQTRCYYNSTVFSANLYTHQPRTYPQFSNSSAGLAGGAPGQNWPFAVNIELKAEGGKNVPNCYEYINGKLGKPVGSFQTEPKDAVCSCFYDNSQTS